MSDIYCTVCGEPWDVEELHFLADDTDREFVDVLREFRKSGCGVFDARCSPRPSIMSAVSRSAFEMMEDDVDGIVAVCEDYKDR